MATTHVWKPTAAERRAIRAYAQIVSDAKRVRVEAEGQPWETLRAGLEVPSGTTQVTFTVYTLGVWGGLAATFRVTLEDGKLISLGA